MRTVVALLLALVAAPAAAAPLDDVARDYVRLVLAVGEHEPGYVDAYYGPTEWADEAKAKKRPLAQLRRDADRLRAAARSIAWSSDPLVQKRQRFLIAHLDAVAARLRFIEGERLTFVDEAEALFGIRPELKPLTAYDPILARVDGLVPGDGPLDERVERFRDRFIVPKDKVDAVVRAATAECRARTIRHVALPAGETFTLELVTDKPWSGYNWYKGEATSLIQINIDLPFRTQRAIDLGCHEGYPGHHVYNMLLEQKLTKKRGWVEFSVYPLYSPMSFIAEGSANYGIDLAFPGDEARAFEAKALYPIAGIASGDATTLDELKHATDELRSAEYTIADAYLAGRMPREQAVANLRKYGLTSQARAEQRLRFIDTYRSYVINYGLGREMVRAYVERAGPDAAARWEAMARVLSEPTLPSDLR